VLFSLLRGGETVEAKVSFRKWPRCLPDLQPYLARPLSSLARASSSLWRCCSALADSPKRFDERSAERCQRVLDLRGNDGVDLPFNGAIALQSAEGLGQHLLGHAADLSLDFAGDCYGKVCRRTAHQGW